MSVLQGEHIHVAGVMPWGPVQQKRKIPPSLTGVVQAAIYHPSLLRSNKQEVNRISCLSTKS